MYLAKEIKQLLEKLSPLLQSVGTVIAMMVFVLFIYDKKIELTYDVIDRAKEQHKEDIDKLREEIRRIQKQNDIFSVRIDSLGKPKKESQCLDHLFFRSIKYYIDNEEWHFGLVDNNNLNAANKNIVDNMLKTKLSFWYCGFRDMFLHRNDFNADSVEKTISSIIKGYKDEWSKLEIPIYVTGRFNERHDKRAKKLSENMRNIFTEKGKNETEEYLKNEFLDYSLTMLNVTIQDMNQIIEQIDTDDNTVVYSKIYNNPVKNKNEEHLDAACMDLYR